MSPTQIAGMAKDALISRKALLLFGLLLGLQVNYSFMVPVHSLITRTPSRTPPGSTRPSSRFTLPRYSVTPFGFGFSVDKNIGAIPFEIGLSAGRLSATANLAIKETAPFAPSGYLMAILGQLIIVFALVSSFCEAALIDGVKHTSMGEQFSIGTSAQVALNALGKVLILLFLFIIASSLIWTLMFWPIFLAYWGHLAWWLAILASVISAVVCLPCLLTLDFLRRYSTRIAVLEGASVSASIKAAKSLLQGRVMFSLKIFLWMLLFQVCLTLLAAAATVLVLVSSAIISLLGPKFDAVSLLGLLALATPVAAFLAAFRSAIWTCAFLKLRIVC